MLKLIKEFSLAKSHEKNVLVKSTLSIEKVDRKGKKLMSFIVVLIFHWQLGYTQQSCLELRNDTLIAFKVPREQMFEAIDKDMEIMSNCLELDSIDRFILTPPVLSTLIAGQALQGEELMYGPLIDSIEKIRTAPEYGEIKTVAVFMIENESKPLSNDGWDQLEPMLSKMLDDEEILAEVEKQFDSAIEEGMNYREFFTYVFSTEVSEEEAPENEFSSPFDIFHDMEPLEAMLERSVENQRPMLLYFSGWGCVNGRRMEESWFEENIFELIETNFTPFMGYADDRTDLTDELRNKWNVNSDVRTLGQCINSFQKEFLKSDSQPFFAIISLDGDVLATHGFTLDSDTFKSFLNTKLD